MALNVSVIIWPRTTNPLEKKNDLMKIVIFSPSVHRTNAIVRHGINISETAQRIFLKLGKNVLWANTPRLFFGFANLILEPKL